MLESGYSYRISPKRFTKKNMTRFNPLCWSQVIPTRCPEGRTSEDQAVSILYVGVRLFLHEPIVFIAGFPFLSEFQSYMLESSYSYAYAYFSDTYTRRAYCFNPLCWSQVIPTQKKADLVGFPDTCFNPLCWSQVIPTAEQFRLLLQNLGWGFNPLCWSQVIPTTLCLSNSSRAQKRRVSILYVGVRLFLQILNLNP